MWITSIYWLKKLYGSSAVDGKRFLESNSSTIRGTLTYPNLKYVPGIEEAFDSKFLLQSTAQDPTLPIW